MEVVLDANLINPKLQYVSLGMVKSGSEDIVSVKDNYEKSYYTQEAV